MHSLSISAKNPDEKEIFLGKLAEEYLAGFFCLRFNSEKQEERRADRKQALFPYKTRFDSPCGGMQILLT